MKLLRLKITDPKGFRSLQPGFEYCFRHPDAAREEMTLAPFICAGPNGSGKSNVLEALAAIFYHLECMRLDNPPRNFEYEEERNPNGFRSEKGNPDAYELEYLAAREQGMHATTDSHAQMHIKICKEVGNSPRFFVLNLETDEGEQETTLDRVDAYLMLPSYVLGYSSGENEILSLPFLKCALCNLTNIGNHWRNRWAIQAALNPAWFIWIVRSARPYCFVTFCTEIQKVSQFFAQKLALI